MPEKFRRTARGSWVLCPLLLASILLGGCNGTSATSTPESSASAPSALNHASAPASTQAAASQAQSPDQTADVSWTPPTTNTNGSALTNLAGFRIYYGTSPSALNQQVDVPSASATDHVIQGLSRGTWYFAVVAYTNTGAQSSFSSVVSKTIS